jgi:antitoxin component of MazEF toxin-antitoxin module
LIFEVITKDIIEMLNYYRSIQRPRKSYHVNLPKPLIDILDLKKGDEVNITLTNDRGEKVVVIRTIPQTTTKEEVKINVVT